jgi:hypothetical protein
MLHSPAHAEMGARFFRREYPRQVAEHQRFFPLVRDYYATGGRPPAGAEGLGEHLTRQKAELDALRRVVHAKTQENKQLRHVITRLAQPLAAETAVHA